MHPCNNMRPVGFRVVRRRRRAGRTSTGGGEHVAQYFSCPNPYSFSGSAMTSRKRERDDDATWRIDEAVEQLQSTLERDTQHKLRVGSGARQVLS
jgi:hypothetical protein